MKTTVEFRSVLFPPYDDGDDEVNPGIFGKRLAEFFIRGLSEKGFQPLEPIPEDWGWVVPIRNKGFRLWIGCGSYAEYPDGFLCFIEPHQPLIRKFLFFGKRDVSARVMALQQAMDELLSAEPGIKHLKWWTYEEFNMPNGRGALG